MPAPPLAETTRRPPHGLRRRISLLLVPLIVAPLYFWRLDATVLWQDEAHTALLARHVLRRGLPFVGQGAESASALAGLDAGWHDLFLHIPPLQSYLCAVGLALAGETPWAARLPFALCGWLCVVLLPWASGPRSDRATVLWAQIVLGTHVPFLLHVRQCRYYAPAALLSLVALGAAQSLAARQDRPWQRNAMLLAVSLSLLALSFEFAWAAATATIALLLLGAAISRSRRSWRSLIAAAAALGCSAAIALAWLALAATAPSRQGGPGSNVNPHFPAFPWYYLGVLNGYVIPVLWLAALAMVIVLLSLARLVQGRRSRLRAAGQSAQTAVVGIVFTLLLAEACMYTRNGFPRYIVPAFPMAVLGAVALVRCATCVALSAGRRRRIALALAALVMASGQWSFRAGTVRTWLPWEAWLEQRTGVTWSRRNAVQLVSYLTELLHPPRGPVAACVQFLNEYAQPGETIVAEYSEKPLKFHTQLRVYGGETGQFPDEPPQWIWVRPFLRLWGEVEQTRRWLATHVDLSQYDRVVVRGVYDSLWENRPHPEWHVFQDEYRRLFPHTRPYLLLYRRRAPSQRAHPGRRVRDAERSTSLAPQAGRKYPVCSAGGM